MKKIVIVDVDGTISKVGDRIRFLQQQNPKDWDSFYEACDEDDPMDVVVELVEGLCELGYGILFCTGRREFVREKTIKWMKENFSEQFMYIDILMRKDGDFRHDTIIKPELLRESGIKLEDIAFVIEDRDSMVAKWREMGLICIQPAPGDF